MVEWKPTDMGYNTCNIQVIVTDESEMALIYLVNDEGVIKQIKSVAMHMINESREQNSALREAHNECKQLQVEASSTRI